MRFFTGFAISLFLLPSVVFMEDLGRAFIDWRDKSKAKQNDAMKKYQAEYQAWEQNVRALAEKYQK